jgi:predicted transposase YdaD
MGKWEESMRKLVHANPQAFIDFMLQGSLQRVRFTGNQQPEKLKNWQLEVDKLLGIEVDGQETLIHFEIETYYDSDMPERLLRYNVLARSELKRPVLSCVVHLLNDGRMKSPPLHWTEPIEGDVLKFHYRVIEVADFLAGDILRRGEVTLLPLLPLTKGGATRENVQLMLGELNARENEDLAFAGFILALAIFDRSKSESGLADREWLIERYNNMYSMLHDLLHVDPMYQAIVQEGEARGEEKERRERILDLQQTAFKIIKANFLQLEEVFKPRISALGDLQRLQQLVDALIFARSEEDVYQAFSACNPDEPIH